MKRMLLLGLALASGCSPAGGAASEPAGLVWVAAHYTGGVQCEPTIRYTPPNTVEVLHREDVTVRATAREGLAVCEACSCPGYSALHYALIAEQDLGRAARAGYQPRTPPSDVLPDSLRPGR